MITTLFFDLDDTLLWDKKSIEMAFQATCQHVKELDPNVLEQAVRNEARKLYESYPTYPFTQMIGINPFEGLWGTFNDAGEDFGKMYQLMPEYQKAAWTNGLKACGIDNPTLGDTLAKQFIKERLNHPYVYPETFDVLDQLKDKYQLLLLTNGAPSLQNTKLTLTPEIAERFNHIVISGDFGRGKPDPKIFEYALNKARVTAEEVMMIGDNLMTDILGANRTGIKNIWINHHKQTADNVIPTYQVDRLKEIIPIIESISRQK